VTEENIAQTVARLSTELLDAQNFSLARGDVHATVLVLPRGRDIRSIKPFLDEYLSRPERIKGTAVLTDIESFVNHTNRFKLPYSVIFADSVACKLTTVFDYHANQATPEFGDHRANYECPKSESWEKWNAFACEVHTQEEMAEFLEDRIMDIGVVDTDNLEYAEAVEIGSKLHKEYALPNKLLELSAKMALTVEMKVGREVNRSSGEAVLSYSEEHKDASTGEKLKVPGLFLLSIEVFRDGAVHHIPARLRYQVKNGTITWKVELYRPDLALAEAFNRVCLEAEQETGLQLFRGSPED
jgi:uncharacterized protein YfdQ (DUF2303 family)